MINTKEPSVDSKRIIADLFVLLGNRPIAANVKGIFEITKPTVGGRIVMIDIIYENGIELMGVPIRNEREVEIPCDFEQLPIKSVAVPNLKRQLEGKPMWMRRK